MRWPQCSLLQPAWCPPCRGTSCLPACLPVGVVCASPTDCARPCFPPMLSSHAFLPGPSPRSRLPSSRTETSSPSTRWAASVLSQHKSGGGRAFDQLAPHLTPSDPECCALLFPPPPRARARRAGPAGRGRGARVEAGLRRGIRGAAAGRRPRGGAVQQVGLAGSAQALSCGRGTAARGLCPACLSRGCERNVFTEQATAQPSVHTCLTSLPALSALPLAPYSCAGGRAMNGSQVSRVAAYCAWRRFLILKQSCRRLDWNRPMPLPPMVVTSVVQPAHPVAMPCPCSLPRSP